MNSMRCVNGSRLQQVDICLMALAGFGLTRFLFLDIGTLLWFPLDLLW